MPVAGNVWLEQFSIPPHRPASRSDAALAHHAPGDASPPEVEAANISAGGLPWQARSSGFRGGGGASGQLAAVPRSGAASAAGPRPRLKKLGRERPGSRAATADTARAEPRRRHQGRLSGRPPPRTSHTKPAKVGQSGSGGGCREMMRDLGGVEDTAPDREIVDGRGQEADVLVPAADVQRRVAGQDRHRHRPPIDDDAVAIARSAARASASNTAVRWIQRSTSMQLAEHHDVVVRRWIRPSTPRRSARSRAVVEVELPAAFEDVLRGQDRLALLHRAHGELLGGGSRPHRHGPARRRLRKVGHGDVVARAQIQRAGEAARRPSTCRPSAGRRARCPIDRPRRCRCLRQATSARPGRRRGCADRW